MEKVEGNISLTTAKRSYAKDEIIEVQVKGVGLKAVNALSFALPYNPADYEFVGVEVGAVKEMYNMTNDRLHTSGEKALYPTFVNLGDRGTLEGDCDLFVIKLKANRNVRFDLQAKDGFWVNKRMEVRKF